MYKMAMLKVWINFNVRCHCGVSSSLDKFPCIKRIKEFGTGLRQLQKSYSLYHFVSMVKWMMSEALKLPSSFLSWSYMVMCPSQGMASFQGLSVHVLHVSIHFGFIKTLSPYPPFWISPELPKKAGRHIQCEPITCDYSGIAIERVKIMTWNDHKYQIPSLVLAHFQG